MNLQVPLIKNQAKHKIVVLLPTILAICIGLTIGLDLLQSKLHSSSFYFSESFMFSSFWWLFLPLLYGQFAFSKIAKKKTDFILLTTIPITAHLFAYPALVWLISKLFYNHTFAYWQTFNYELVAYSFILLMIYTVSLFLFILFKNKVLTKPGYSAIAESPKQKDYVTSLMVSEGNKQIAISTNDILYLSANSPYINIYHIQKRYLHNETLKSVSEKLDNGVFVRVHKSVIVNIKKVQSYKSRLNGDYDLTMTDGTELRLSRNYAPAFKLKFGKGHQDTAE